MNTPNNLPTSAVIELATALMAGNWMREHLGYSSIGSECFLNIWLSWRWATDPKFSGRLLRLFNRGHREEEEFIADLERIGFKWLSNQDTYKGYKGHAGGSSDGRGINLPELMGIEILVEMKTAAEKAYKEIVKKGCREAKPEHYAQIQCYLFHAGLTHCLYIVVNKNTDHLYTEIIAYDDEAARYYLARAEQLINAEVPPAKLSESPSWYKCKMCTHYELCHGNALPVKTCRSCVHSTPVDGGKWVCEFKGKVLPVEDQKAACNSHVNFPALVKSEIIATDKAANTITYANGFVDGGF